MSNAPRTRLSREPIAAKVPEIGLVFWIIKIITTGMGESASDFLAHSNALLAAAIGVLGFAVAMFWQLRTDRYRAVAYWFAVAMVAVFGTMVADGVHVALGLPYPVTTALAALALAAILLYWHRTEGTLSIHRITTRRREVLYWLTVLATFALGTAAGDLTAYSMHLGYLASSVFFAAVMVVPLLAWRFGVNEVFAFWFAYVVTRPLGASIADWLGKPSSKGHGLGYGDGTVTAVAFVAFMGLVAYVAVMKRDIQTPELIMRDEAAAVR